MKTLTAKILRLALLAVTACFCTTGHAQVTNAWDAGGGDGLWNTDANWESDITPGVLTNAVIGSGTSVNYNSAMTSPSIGSLIVKTNSTLDINASGFNVDGSGSTGNAIVLGTDLTTGTMNINSSGVVLVTNSGPFLISTNSGAVTVNTGGLLIITNSTTTDSMLVGPNVRILAGTEEPPRLTINGGTVTMSGRMTIAGSRPGSGAGANIGSQVILNSGQLNCLGGSRINNTADDGGQFLLVNGGTANLGNFSVSRSISTAGLVVTNGVVNATAIQIGVGNSRAFANVYGGFITNTGVFTVSDTTNAANSGERRSQFLHRGGTIVSTGSEGLIIGARTNLLGGNPNNNIGGIYEMTAGTLFVEKITLIKEITITNAGGRFFLGGGTVYLGSGGLVNNAQPGSNTVGIFTITNGTLAAQADWSSSATITNNGGTAVFKAADQNGTAHNITLSGPVNGNGALTKEGNGVLTLNGTNTYPGNTLINGGTLALGPNASISNSLAILTTNNAIFDVSAVSGGYVLNDSRTLGGFGVVTGNVTLASGAIVSPGNSPGTLTFTNNLTASGGANFKFDLPYSPSSGSNDLLIVGGTLTVAGINNLEANGAGAPGTVYPLIKYGTFSGNVTNFDVSVATGVISNNASTKTLYLIVQATTRAPTNTVWAGLTSQGHGNLWDDTVTNWVTQAAGTPTIFISGDNTKFTNAGAGIQTNISLIGTLTPGSVTVDSTANYTFGGNGRISGSDSVTKSNTGTLTILTTNNYTGPTTIGGGVLAANTLADGASSSSIGAASVDPTNLVVSGGTLRYLGDTVTITRGATVAGTGGTIDVTNPATTLTMGTLTGSGILTKAGVGTLALGPANTLSGGSVISGGVLQLNATDAAGTGGITNNGRTLRLNGIINPTNIVEFNGNCVVDVGNPGGSDARGLLGAWSGNATVLITNMTNSTATFTIGGNGAGGGGMTNFSGTVSMGDCIGFLRFNDAGNQNFGSSNLTVDLGNRSVFNSRNGTLTIEFGELRGGPNTQLRGKASGGGTEVNYQIGGKNISSTYDGVITNGNGGTTALTKVGSATLRLTGTNNYTGATAISSGALQVDGELGNTIIQVNSGATLSGNGTIAGLIFANSGSTVAPGASVGTLSLTNGGMIIQDGALAIEINKSLPLTNDFVNVSNCSITVISGSVTVTNLGPALIVGDKFVLCNQPFSGGSALTVTGAGCTWTNNLEVDGSISVLTAPAVVNPVISSVVKSGNNFIFSGSNGPTSGNFIVFSSTNVATPIASWTPTATNPFNPNGTFAFTNAINFNVRQTFYRIQTQ